MALLCVMLLCVMFQGDALSLLYVLRAETVDETPRQIIKHARKRARILSLLSLWHGATADASQLWPLTRQQNSVFAR